MGKHKDLLTDVDPALLDRLLAESEADGPDLDESYPMNEARMSEDDVRGLQVQMAWSDLGEVLKSVERKIERVRYYKDKLTLEDIEDWARQIRDTRKLLE